MSGIHLNIEFCCTCLKVGAQDDRFLSLKFAPPEDITFANKLKYCVPEMGLENSDEYYLCKSCSVALETAYTFRCMCLKTEGRLEEFKLSQVKNCRTTDRSIKLELIEAMCTEEVNIEPEQKYDISSAAQPDQVSATCLTELERPCTPAPSMHSKQNDPITMEEVEDIVDMDIVELLSNPDEGYPKERTTRIETVKDELGSLLTESLGNTVDINIRIFDNSVNNKPEFNSDINIFNSLNAEIEELTKHSMFSQPEQPPKDTRHSKRTNTKQENVKEEPKILTKLLLARPAPLSRKKKFSDAELLEIYCQTIPELNNCPVQALQCQVALEKITVASLPVKTPQKKKYKSMTTLKKDTRGKAFWCHFCNKDVYRKERFNSHILQHINIKGYKCEVCRQGFFSGEGLDRHQKKCKLLKDSGAVTSAALIATPSKSVASKASPKKPVSRTEGRIQKSSRRKPIKTENVKFKRVQVPSIKIRKSLRRQTVPKRLDDVIYRCEICSYQSYHKQKYQVHILRHAGAGSFRCEECPKRYYEKCELNRHLRNDHQLDVNSTRPKIRKGCASRLTKMRKNCKTVAIKSTNAESDVLPSVIEPEITLTVNSEMVITPVIQSIQSLASSTIQGEPIEVLFSCTKCSISFKSRNLLILHTKTHEWKHSCDVCKQEFTSESSLQQHTLIHHNTHEVFLETDPDVEMQLEPPPKAQKKKKKKYFCPICTSEFSSRDHANVHTGAKPYLCKLCGKYFAAYTTLRKHRRIHEKDADESPAPAKKVRRPPAKTQCKTLTCEICEKHFKSRELLYSHDCQNASGEAVYRCQICKLAYIGRTALIEHMGVHVSQGVE